MRKSLRKLFSSGLLAAAAMAAGSVSAMPVGLAIVLDESGSISSINWTLQRTGYANVLGSSLITTDGALVIGVWKFDSTVEQVFAPTLIDSDLAKSQLVAAVSGMVQGGGGTAIGSGITTAFNGFAAYAGGAGSTIDSYFRKMVIDVSTDGDNTTGIAPATAVANAVAGGVDQVNCLGIGGGASCGWNRPVDLDFTATSFADFQAILALKIEQETQVVPEPGSLALAALGCGLALVRRRRSKL